MTRLTPEQAGGANRVAFLDMLAHSEIGPALLPLTDDGYSCLVGSTPARPIIFTSYADHPNKLEKLSATLSSTAAGRYQLLARYWPPYKKLLGLQDFSPASQDRVALQQIKECKALPLIDAGKLLEAIRACARIWASLPGAGYHQHENTAAALLGAYRAAGGTLAEDGVG